MIKSFQDKKTEEFFSGKTVKQFSAFKKAAERKLAMLDSATELRDLRPLLPTGWKNLKETGPGSIASASMTSGGYVLYGRKTDRMKLKLPIIIRETAKW